VHISSGEVIDTLLQEFLAAAKSMQLEVADAEALKAAVTQQDPAVSTALLSYNASGDR
jgi:hypothetical protein